ncbi:hypothetical protein D3C72_579050 [compost metagenome]
MAHIGTIRKIIGAQFAGKQLKQERRFVGGATGGVKLDRIRWEFAQYFANACKRLFPFDRAEGVALPVILHRLRQTTIAFEFEIAFCQQGSHRVFGEKRRGDAFAGGFPGHGFGAVFAELEGGFMLFVGPCAARAVKSVRLVGAKQGRGGIEGVHLRANGDGGGFQRSPSPGGTIIVPDSWNRAAFVIHVSSDYVDRWINSTPLELTK